MSERMNTGKARRLTTLVRHIWSDQVAGNRALLRRPPYDDYLINRRGWTH
jgi:hypothetical protein